VTKRMNPERLHRLITWYAPALQSLTSFFDRNIVTRQINFHFLPYYNYRRYFPMFSREQLIEYGIHDTFDALTPAYDYPQTERDVERWLREAGFTQYTFRPAGPVQVIATKPGGRAK